MPLDLSLEQDNTGMDDPSPVFFVCGFGICQGA